MHDAFPPEFDCAFYRDNNSDLESFSDEQLVEHFEKHGRSEGRLASSAASRAGFLRIIQRIVPALEIGPFDRPAFEGQGAKFFNVLPTEELRNRAKELPGRDPNGVPIIDFVSSTGDLSIIKEDFKLVFSSHVIEHQPDFIAHLENVSTLLFKNGYYALIVPDCRYCFDHFLPPSNIANIIDAHLNGRRLHRLASIIEHRALTTHNNAARHWRGDHSDDKPDLAKRVKKAIAEWQDEGDQYIDVHAWQFTPQSFKVLLSVLHELSLVGLRPLRVYDTPFGSNEFCAVLTKD